ncbi:MAG TPA: branched-chain amino acid ABC transporter permease [Rhodocyclaceae bacterium]|nr:MAG: branched-chain amino acid ABC transporter permease [Betaproteobacteria bacterium CG2_30_68_42]PIX76345.1 MAG: branched-chain amino acid ABC transporter permease [Rhodocyclales bacterium CG_4_10_14_3_um_filter_68_10]PJA57675.1 MAG: branched-chain amino acid ABC transporter permease [Rhodocyclales bacterium CG_4_9_14_3_um_filter_68_10]HCX32123.1 branched-chain amino acid ABC transporter permease [Rhodocyclaceae bacterium]
MLSEFFQFLFSGITSGSIYALAALGFSIIFNASGVINFAQGEFIMIGGMVTVFLVKLGVPVWAAAPAAVLAAMAVGLALDKLAIEPARNAGVVALIIITIGASIFLQGIAQVLFGKGQHALPAFSGDVPLRMMGATLLPQSLWVIGVTVVIVAAMWWFFSRTLTGKAMLATAANPLAAQLVGIDTRFILLLSFALAAVLGAVAGIIVAPITLTSYDVGIMLGLKGFVAATLGGLGSFAGAVAGGVLLGIAEAMAAGYLSSEYKDAVPFVLIILVLFFLPRGLFGARVTERV